MFLFAFHAAPRPVDAASVARSGQCGKLNVTIRSVQVFPISGWRTGVLARTSSGGFFGQNNTASAELQSTISVRQTQVRHCCSTNTRRQNVRGGVGNGFFLVQGEALPRRITYAAKLV